MDVSVPCHILEELVYTSSSI